MKSKRNFIIIIAVFAIALAAWAIGNRNDQAPSNAAGAPMVDVVVPETLSEKAQIGKIAFDKYCVSCHGENAAGQDGVAPPLVHIYYEPNHHGDMAFLSAMARGVQAHHWPFGNMPPVEGIAREEADDVIVYIRELQRANGIE